MKRRVDTKDRIIAAARQLFHEQGYGATGVSTILREAQVNSGSLYHYFPTKEAVLEAVLEHYLERLEPEVLVHAEKASDDPVEKIFALINGYRQALIFSEFRFGCPIGNLALEIGQERGRATELIDANFRQWRAAVEKWLDAAPLAEGADRKSLAAFILTVMEGAVMQARTAKSIEPFDQSVAELRRYVDGLVAA